MKYRYIVNGGQSCRGFALITFGEDTVSRIEAILDCLDGMREISVSATSKLGNRITISKEA